MSKIEQRRDFTRVLVHIDMDAFYANVEIKDNPELATKPMAVGSDSMLVVFLFFLIELKRKMKKISFSRLQIILHDDMVFELRCLVSSLKSYVQN